ncbi:MAG: translation initiation factor [Candidatus Azobacteroides sp.]|nr:translation initiation factor [Candidatus Azobacteroides sp.]
MKDNDWKKRLSIVYLTNPDFNYEENAPQEEETIPAEKQLLRIKLDKRHRNGKSVTLIPGFIGSAENLKTIEKLLKQKCGVGGSSKDGEIIIQGDFRQKILEILKKEGYGKTKII